MRIQKLFLVSVLGSLVSACGGAAAADQTAPNQPTAADRLADPTSGDSSGYFRVRADDRACEAPLCQGYFVKRVNRDDTVCSDGVVRPECYVAELDTKQLGLDQTTDGELRAHVSAFLLRGTLSAGSTQTGALAIDEAWRGHEGLIAQGDYLRTTSTGLVCITYPCLSYQAELLNSGQAPQYIAEVRLGNIGNDREKAQQQIYTSRGLMVAAQLGTVSGPAGNATALDTTEYFLPFAEAKVGTACGTRGTPDCPQGQFCKYPLEALCGAADRPGFCSVPPEQCTQEYTPVCGCNGQAYSSACQAAASSMSVSYIGECKTQS
jgi:hypothetical protein